MITIVNNCLQYTELGAQFEKQYVIYGAPRQLIDSFKRLKDGFIVSMLCPIRDFIIVTVIIISN